MRNFARGIAMLGGICGLGDTGTQAMDQRELTIVAFGTSLTARGGWQEPLQSALSQCLQRQIVVRTVALSGATSAWGLAKLDEVVEARPDVVLIEFYANDAALNRFVTVPASRANMRAILTTLMKHLPHVRIIVMALNPISGIRGAIRPFLENYIDAHRRLAADLSIEFFDNRPAWRLLTPEQLRAAIPDGAHPAPDIAAQTIVPGLTETIAQTRCPMPSDRDNGAPR